ncbi:hypothetical protein HMPREF0185_02990 [Brevundimonas diminuta 470-4]|nr:hypothetical protein HMPREF0185_02990 [Brevundimonas diminuta 470-4]
MGWLRDGARRTGEAARERASPSDAWRGRCAHPHPPSPIEGEGPL